MQNASGGLNKPKAPAGTPNPTLHVDKLRIAADILDSIDDYISAFDRDWNFIYINKKTAESLGSTTKELLRKKLWKRFQVRRNRGREKLSENNGKKGYYTF